MTHSVHVCDPVSFSFVIMLLALCIVTVSQYQCDIDYTVKCSNYVLLNLVRAH